MPSTKLRVIEPELISLRRDPISRSLPTGSRCSLFALFFAIACFAGIGMAQQPLPPLPDRPELPAVPAAPINRPAVQPAFAVVIDAAHGGGNVGARFSGGLLEKDVTLALSIRLRAMLVARGMMVITTRDSDDNPAFTERAGVANHALAAACLVLHATASGSGVHLFTSSLAPAANPGVPVPWQTAQASWITRSLRLSSEINSSLGQAGIPVTLGSTELQPLDNLTCPAVAIEIAPLMAGPSNGTMAVSDPVYRQRILDALVAAVVQWSADWKQQP
jgi:N-acetylmuramoyl-L-alanine amidase